MISKKKKVGGDRLLLLKGVDSREKLTLVRREVLGGIGRLRGG